MVRSQGQHLAVSDLFYQGADSLPAYMASLERDYLLTANRIYAVADKEWKVAWIANGAGEVMGAEFGRVAEARSVSAATCRCATGAHVPSSPALRELAEIARPLERAVRFGYDPALEAPQELHRL